MKRLIFTCWLVKIEKLAEPTLFCRWISFRRKRKEGACFTSEQQPLFTQQQVAAPLARINSHSAEGALAGIHFASDVCSGLTSNLNFRFSRPQLPLFLLKSYSDFMAHCSCWICLEAKTFSLSMEGSAQVLTLAKALLKCLSKPACKTSTSIIYSWASLIAPCQDICWEKQSI